MQTYENAYFGLRIDVPERWRLVNWKHAKIKRTWRDLYQMSDDALPTDGPSASKFLFTATLYRPESEVTVDAEIDIAVFRSQIGEDLRQSLLQNFERMRPYYERNGITSSITDEGTWRISGIDFGFVDQESKSSVAISRYRFFFRRVSEGYALQGRVAGHNAGAFAEGVRIVQAMECEALGQVKGRS
jgi:hypothetical protein